MQKNILKNFLSVEEKQLIADTVKECEKYTSGEICISIKNNKPLFHSKDSIAQIAHKQFYKLGLQNTKENSAVMIFIILHQREFYILADKGIHTKVGNETWNAIKEKMQSHFVSGNFATGLVTGIKEIGRVLKEHFPAGEINENELSDSIDY